MYCHEQSGWNLQNILTVLLKFTLIVRILIGTYRTNSSRPDRSSGFVIHFSSPLNYSSIDTTNFLVSKKVFQILCSTLCTYVYTYSVLSLSSVWQFVKSTLTEHRDIFLVCSAKCLDRSQLYCP